MNCDDCPHKGDCALMQALILRHEEHIRWWNKEVVPTLKRADELIKKLREG